MRDDRYTIMPAFHSFDIPFSLHDQGEGEAGRSSDEMFIGQVG